jgi:hypothetical protein
MKRLAEDGEKMPEELTLEVLKSIREEIRGVREEIRGTNERVSRLEMVFEGFSRKQLESEVRVATELLSLSGAVRTLSRRSTSDTPSRS